MKENCLGTGSLQNSCRLLPWEALLGSTNKVEPRIKAGELNLSTTADVWSGTIILLHRLECAQVLNSLNYIIVGGQRSSGGQDNILTLLLSPPPPTPGLSEAQMESVWWALLTKENGEEIQVAAGSKISHQGVTDLWAGSFKSKVRWFMVLV